MKRAVLAVLVVMSAAACGATSSKPSLTLSRASGPPGSRIVATGNACPARSGEHDAISWHHGYVRPLDVTRISATSVRAEFDVETPEPRGLASVVLHCGSNPARAAFRVTEDPNLQKALAYVQAHCAKAFASTEAREWISGWRDNALYGNCKAGDGTDQHIWFFRDGRFVGEDTRTGSGGIIGMWRDGSHFAFMYVMYRTSDPQCCATGGGKIVRFKVRRNDVRRLDPLPPTYRRL